MTTICTQDPAKMTSAQRATRKAELEAVYREYQKQGLQLDMSRGKPCTEQLDLTLDMLECVNARDGYKAENGLDVRNYGLLDGLPEAKKLFGDVLHMPPEAVIVGVVMRSVPGSGSRGRSRRSRSRDPACR